ncbi:MAG: hypothetical protein A2007_01375 [Verrucomicrobia bacterium GWC2_42_7]|nr:MAG: hypothetical protein A2007_01375 [Verrucomicrobia bacterium GWC2_42_7]
MNDLRILPCADTNLLQDFYTPNDFTKVNGDQIVEHNILSPLHLAALSSNNFKASPTVSYCEPSIVVFGVHHKLAPLSFREKLSLSADNFYLHNGGIIKESVLINTCNRLEIYAVVSNIFEEKQLVTLFETMVQVPINPNFFFFKKNTEAIHHLFCVACGIESQFFGEAEILSQIKKAYSTATSKGKVGPILHRVFQKSLQASKWARSSDNFIKNPTSLASIAYSLINKFCIAPKIVVLGTGKCGQQIIRTLTREGFRDIYVANRTPSLDLIKRYSLTELSLDKALGSLSQFDVLLLALGESPHIIKKCLLPKRKNKQLIIDFGVPRNIHPDCKKLNHIIIYDLEEISNLTSIPPSYVSTQTELWKANLITKAKAVWTRFEQEDH